MLSFLNLLRMLLRTQHDVTPTMSATANRIATAMAAHAASEMRDTTSATASSNGWVVVGILGLDTSPSASAIVELQPSSHERWHLSVALHHEYPAEEMQPFSSLSAPTRVTASHGSSHRRWHLDVDSHHV